MAEFFRLETQRALLVWTDAQLPDLPVRDRVMSIRTSRVGVQLVSDEADLAGHLGAIYRPCPVLCEERQYTLFLRGKGGAGVEIRHRDPTLIRSHRFESGASLVAMVNFRSSVGRSSFHVYVDNQPEFAFEVEVLPSKLDYDSDFADLLADVQEIAAGLVVEYLRATYSLAGVAPGGASTTAEWLAILKAVLEDLEKASRRIAERPSWGFTQRRQLTRAHRLRKLDSAARLCVARGGGSGQWIMAQCPVREKLLATERRPTLDTAEHRWIAAQLRRIRRRISGLRQRQLALRGEIGARSATIRAELGAIEGRVNTLERLAPFAAASGPPPPNFASLRLLSAPAYQDAYRALLILSMGLSIDGGAIHTSTKDLHLLYEYWCFIALLRLIAEELDVPLPVTQLVSVRETGLSLDLERGRTRVIAFQGGGGRRLVVSYNPVFGGEGFLVPQKPDFLLTFEAPDWPSMHLVVDAKYRVDTSPEYRSQFGAAGPPPDAINVLHRYRDAIIDLHTARGEAAPKRTVVEGAVLFPAPGGDGDAYSSSRLHRSLDVLGVGALPFLPSNQEHVREWLRKVIMRGGWSTADRVITDRAADQAHKYRGASVDTALVIGISRDSDWRTLEWARQSNRWYTPLSSDARQFQVRAIAVPRVLRNGQRLLDGYHSVRAITVVEQRMLGVAARGEGDPFEPQVVYELDGQFTISALEVPRSEFPDQIWTSRLALERARVFAECFLDSEEDWRQVEALEARRIPYQVELKRDPTRGLRARVLAAVAMDNLS